MPQPGPPKFENVFLQSLADAIGRRRKAISYHAEDMTLERGRDDKGSVEFERLDLRIEFLTRGTVLHFTAWEDSIGWISLRHHQRKRGWTYRLELHTELWDMEPDDIVRRIEATMAMRPRPLQRATSNERDLLKQLWSTIGPSRPQRSRRRM